MTREFHTPVLLEEAMGFLAPSPGKVYVDATLGGGGHAEAILKGLKGKGALIGIDRDEEAIIESRKKLQASSGIIHFVRDNFASIKNIIKKLGIAGIDGILFDLGVSSHQLDEDRRGFSLQKEGPLDMRMDQASGSSVKEVVNSLKASELERIMKEFGEERMAASLARGIVGSRPLSSTLDLSEAIQKSLKGLPPKVIFDSTIRVFQALRIFVNDELANLSRAVSDSIDVLLSGGRIVVISYHSLEDRIVKDIFKGESVECVCPPIQPVCTCDHVKRLKVITKKPVTAGSSEVRMNPRSRSAKLRAAQRI